MAKVLILTEMSKEKTARLHALQLRSLGHTVYTLYEPGYWDPEVFSAIDGVVVMFCSEGADSSYVHSALGLSIGAHKRVILCGGSPANSLVNHPNVSRVNSLEELRLEITHPSNQRGNTYETANLSTGISGFFARLRTRVVAGYRQFRTT